MQVSEADRRIDRLVREISAVVNRRTGANSAIRQVGVDPATPRGVRIAAADAIVIGAEDAGLLAKLDRRIGAARRFDESNRALREVVESVTDLAVRLDHPEGDRRPPSERGRWDRPQDRDHLDARAGHRNLQAAITGATTEHIYGDVVTELARRGVVRREFASEVGWAGRPPRSALTAGGVAFVERLSEKLPGSDRKVLLARLNSRPPELKSAEAADRLLGGKVAGWEYLDQLPHRAALGRLAGQLEQDFDGLDPSRPAVELEHRGRRIAERAADEAGRIAAGLEPEGRDRPQQQAVPMTMLDGVATAGSGSADSRPAQDPPPAKGHGVRSRPITQEP